jgi:hypothetical protein
MIEKPADTVYRRIVIEYGQVYAYAYYLNENGKILAEECWKQPFRLDRRDVQDEAGDTWDMVYQHLQDTVLWSASDADGAGKMEPDPPEE